MTCFDAHSDLLYDVARRRLAGEERVLETRHLERLRAGGVEGLVLGIAVIQMSMPVAVNGSMLCMEYGGDQSCMAQITLVSTAASIVTIPLLAAALL